MIATFYLVSLKEFKPLLLLEIDLLIETFVIKHFSCFSMLEEQEFRAGLEKCKVKELVLMVPIEHINSFDYTVLRLYDFIPEIEI